MKKGKSIVISILVLLVAFFTTIFKVDIAGYIDNIVIKEKQLEYTNVVVGETKVSAEGLTIFDKNLAVENGDK